MKAQRVEFFIGNIRMRGYLLSDGRKKLAGRSVTDAIGEPDQSLTQKLGVKSLKALPHADLSLTQVKADSGETFIPVAIEDAVVYWATMSERGNKTATALMIALASESIERRMDSALEIKVSEIERNRQLIDRMHRLQLRRDWTDCVKEYQERHGYYRTTRGTEEFRQLTRHVNVRLFGVPHFNCDRDTMTQKQQQLIQAFETTLIRKAEQFPTANPVEWVMTALDCF